MYEIIQFKLIETLLILVICCSVVAGWAGNMTNKSIQRDIGFFDEINMNLNILNSDTGEISKLVHVEDETSGLCLKTVWSPDGSKFAFTGIVNGVLGTYVADADGHNLDLILSQSGEEAEGVEQWHPELGLIFVMKSFDGNAEIYSVIDRTNMTNLTNLPSWEFFPSLFPDGRIAFVSNMDEPQNAEPTFENVYVLDHKTLKYEFLLSMTGMTVKSMSKTGIFPDISPDGKRMSFTLDGDIYVINTDGTNMTNITNTPELTEMTSSFSPDGSHILYSGEMAPLADDIPNFNLFKINLETLEKTQLTFGNDNMFTHPVYRPVKWD